MMMKEKNIYSFFNNKSCLKKHNQFFFFFSKMNCLLKLTGLASKTLTLRSTLLGFDKYLHSSVASLSSISNKWNLHTLAKSTTLKTTLMKTTDNLALSTRFSHQYSFTPFIRSIHTQNSCIISTGNNNYSNGGSLLSFVKKNYFHSVPTTTTTIALSAKRSFESAHEGAISDSTTTTTATTTNRDTTTNRGKNKNQNTNQQGSSSSSPSVLLYHNPKKTLVRLAIITGVFQALFW